MRKVLGLGLFTNIHLLRSSVRMVVCSPLSTRDRSKPEDGLGPCPEGGGVIRRSVNTEQPFTRGSYRW